MSLPPDQINLGYQGCWDVDDDDDLGEQLSLTAGQTPSDCMLMCDTRFAAIQLVGIWDISYTNGGKPNYKL